MDAAFGLMDNRGALDLNDLAAFVRVVDRTLVTLSRRGQLPAVRALVDFLVAEYPGAVAAP